MGGITIASDGDSVTGLWFDGQRFFADTLSPEHEERALPVFDLTRKWLDVYFSGKNPDFMPPVSLNGTPFQMQVWEILKTIPYGTTITYRDIAKEIERVRGIASMSSQAVGGAVGRNPVSIIVPCHRVVGSNGSLTGYAGGIDTKIALLRAEHIDTSQFSLPKLSSY